MRYMLLINTEERWDELSPAEQAEAMAAYGTFFAELEAAGAHRSSNRLRPSATATTVRVRDGKTLTTDGPFVESKEHLGGYFEIEASDLDAAIEWAAKIPGARVGAVEVRPVWEDEG